MYYCTYFRSLQGITISRKIYIQAWHCLAPSHCSPHFKYKRSSNYFCSDIIKFVKKGAKVPHKRSPPVGILHHASDWVLIADLNSNFCFPVHITFTWLRPDITIFSNYLRKVILIELACPCQGKMESWHSNKINKYLALKTSIESNGWCVEHFAVQVGARGYCSKSVLCSFKKPGFSNTLIRDTIKKLSKSCMECLFCIWLARNNKDWNPSTANCNLNCFRWAKRYINSSKPSSL